MQRGRVRGRGVAGGDEMQGSGRGEERGRGEAGRCRGEMGRHREDAGAESGGEAGGDCRDNNARGDAGQRLGEAGERQGAAGKTTKTCWSSQQFSSLLRRGAHL